MLLLMKPRISLPYSDDFTAYSLGISTSLNSIDQKLNVMDLEPGLHTVVSVTPQFFQTTEEFRDLHYNSRKCKFPHELIGLKSTKTYSRTACEHECAFMKAVSLCKCAPWYYRNDSSTVPICDMYGGYCFNRIMSTRKFYKACPEECLEDCDGMQLSWEKSFRPINIDKICKRGSVLFEFLKKSENQHFSQNYYNRWKLATEDYQKFEELYEIMKDGNMSDHYLAQCKEFVAKYVSIVTVETPTDVITLILRNIAASFHERVGVLGGELGLFTGLSIISILDYGSSIYLMIWPEKEKEDSSKNLKVKIKQNRKNKQRSNEKKIHGNPDQTRFDQLEDKVNFQGKLMDNRMYIQERKIETIMNEIKSLHNVSFHTHNFGNTS